MQSERHINLWRLSVILAGQLFLSACSDTGSGAGDTQADDETIALIGSFTGIYDLPDNWNGSQQTDEAFLQISAANAQGRAAALLYDVDDIANCIPANPAQEGVVFKDPFGLDESVFMDNILQFNEAIIELLNSTLLISFEDVGDLDGDGNVDERATLRAPAVGVSSIGDLSPGACSL